MATPTVEELEAEIERLTASIESKDEIIRSQRTAYFQLQARVEELEAVVDAAKKITNKEHSAIQSAYWEDELVLLEALAKLKEST